jgi:hypothetical protein
MSKRSRQRKQRRLEAEQKRVEQIALAVIPEEEPFSIAKLLESRLDDLNQIHKIPDKIPAVKVAPSTGHELPSVEPWPEQWPVCPSSCNPMEWRRALEAKEYYENQVKNDPDHKPWHQHPKHPWQYSEFVYCTPEMMQTLLEHMPFNRKEIDSWTTSVIRDIKNDRWLQTHESMCINLEGNMQDGQHRAKGVIGADKAWPIYITWNVPKAALYVTDSGQKRKINEKLALLFPESKITPKTAALCRAMMWGLSNRNMRYSESEIAEFAVKHRDVLDWIATKLRTYRADIQAVCAKGVLWWGEEVIGPFVERLRTHLFTDLRDPAHALHFWLMKARKEGRRTSYATPQVYYRKTLSAICAAAENKDAAKLFQKQDDIFEWSVGWAVPEGAPCGGNVFMPQPEPVQEEMAAHSK